MPRHLTVRHTTEYRYSEPVSFGRHRLMLRPRDSHDLRLLDTRLTITPRPLRVQWVYDAFANSVAYAEFGDVRDTVLRFESEITVALYETETATAMLLKSAELCPFSYGDDELPDLRSVITLNRPDPAGALADWARQIVKHGDGRTLSVLTDMVTKIRSDFTYQRRNVPGTQDPVQTLELKTGSCRDFALLMIEAVRSLGMAARFVSGYIYSPARQATRGGGATHAWVQVYLPGCGWIEIDPTNSIFGNRDLIRVAVARDHKQASPILGSFVGRRSAYIGMTVDVDVLGATQAVA